MPAALRTYLLVNSPNASDWTAMRRSIQSYLPQRQRRSPCRWTWDTSRGHRKAKAKTERTRRETKEKEAKTAGGVKEAKE
eukprot:6091107-Amphidinium_carterae.1